MKSKTITHIILEGCDGVGKDTICSKLWRKYDFKQRVYVRGEISDYVYAKKYNRRFISTQRGLPFLYVVLLGDPSILRRNIMNRQLNEDENLSEELEKISDNKLFKDAAVELQNDYHIIVINCKRKTVEQLVEQIYESTISYINSLSCDRELNNFNLMYKLGCERCGKELTVKNNQPFIDDEMVMADAHLHNGQFETYSDKTLAHNLIFSLAYSRELLYDTQNINKDIDFCYPINSKILMRPEAYEYFSAFEKHQKTCLTTDSKYIPKLDCIRTFEKCFGDEYIMKTAKARATIYTSRDLANIKMMTVRAYEAALANQIIFVDTYTDPDNEILSQIFNEDNELNNLCKKLLYVTPETICQNYNVIMKQPQIYNHILSKQREWYINLANSLIKSEV